jgi:hypothetical protein
VKIGTRITAMVALVATTLGCVGVAEAGSKGRRNTAIGLGAVGVYGLVTKQPAVAVAGLGGAAVSYAGSRRSARRERNIRNRRIRNARLARNNGSRRVVRSNNRRNVRNSNRRGVRNNNRRVVRNSRNVRTIRANNRPPGWDRGRKTGWNGRSRPPGQRRR